MNSMAYVDRLVEVLDSAGIQYAIVGGLAAIAWGVPRFTQGVDLVAELPGELDELTQVLPDTLSCLKPDGRLAIISYHSLEDRIVKRFFQNAATGCTCPPKLPICACGKKPQVEIITRRSVTPTDEEKAHNPRSRSARLRVARRLPS